ncbi:MAG: acyltransferase [Verrucomicrobiota bacterium]
MRAAAIVGVVISHLTGYVPDLLFSHALDKLGMPGVEIFFVLSGFLIGGILVRLLDQGRFSQRGELLHFWLNRWFRTLPLYFLYLAAIVLFTTQHPFAERLRIYELYPFFLQNFAWNIGMTSFSHSWSLTIEESFYLFFPLILWLFLRVVPQRPRRVFFATILLFLLVPFILRVIHGPAANMAASMHRFESGSSFDSTR